MYQLWYDIFIENQGNVTISNLDFTDSEYGYTGDRSFDTAPIPRDDAKAGATFISPLFLYGVWTFCCPIHYIR